MNRKDTYRVGLTAWQAGFSNADEAIRALEIGARFLAHGITDYEIDEMIHRHYRNLIGGQL